MEIVSLSYPNVKYGCTVKGNEGVMYTIYPAPNPYAGATFTISGEWMFLSKIYHPFFSEGKRICSCLTQTANPQNILDTIMGLLGNPELLSHCENCSFLQSALFEMKHEPSFYARKAAANTPGTYPLSDDELRRCSSNTLTPPNMEWMLKTGAFSDVKVIVGKTTFRCHRTVLSVYSSVFKTIFSKGDGGVVHVDCRNPRVFARFLQFLYSGNAPWLHNISTEECLLLVELSWMYSVRLLFQLGFSSLMARLCVDNCCQILQLMHRLGMLSFSLNVCSFISNNIDAVKSTTGWQKLKTDAPSLKSFFKEVVKKIPRNHLME